MKLIGQSVDLAAHFNAHLLMCLGGAGRDRTDDLKLAKLALSQLSYGPDRHWSTEWGNTEAT
jgi:hypothetical protein